MNLSQLNRVYLVGIGGIGMSALARYFKAKGAQVAGYDKVPSLLTDSLQLEGIEISFKDQISSLPSGFESDDQGTMIIYTPAIPKDNEILNYFINKGFNLKKRSEVLGLISRDSFCLAVAGTHGKTSTSALLSHIMNSANTGLSAFVGGIMNNYDSNLIIGDKNVVVVEADEFDKSFLRLRPNIACITAIDADHLDIYNTVEEFEKTFVEFSNLVEDQQMLIVHNSINLGRGLTYSIGDHSDFVALNVRVENSSFVFDVELPNGDIFCDVVSNLPGRHNVENSLAAFAMAYQYGIEPQQIANALKTFAGIKRRFNIFSYENKIVVDDYAHHPAEIRSAINAARELYPGKSLKVIFQPHLFSRTRDFMTDFAIELSKCDSLRLMEIYPARELPIEGVTSQALLEMVSATDKLLIDRGEIASEIKLCNQDVVMMLGAGDIGVEVEKLREIKC